MSASGVTPVILDVVALTLMVAGAALMAAALLTPVFSRLQRWIREAARRGWVRANSLKLWLFLWLLAVAVWSMLLGMLLVWPR